MVNKRINRNMSRECHILPSSLPLLIVWLESLINKGYTLKYTSYLAVCGGIRRGILRGHMMSDSYPRATKSPRKDKGYTWWAYITVPESLRPLILTESGQPKKQLKQTLGTKDEREASDRLANVEADFYREFEEANKANHPLVLSAKAIQESKGIRGLDPIEPDWWFDSEHRWLAEDMIRNQAGFVMAQEVDAGDPETAMSIMEAQSELEMKLENFKEEFKKYTEEILMPKPKGYKFEDVAKEYFESLNISPDSSNITRHKTKDEYISKTKYFNEWRPNLFLSDFSKSLATRYLEHLDQQGFAKDTIGKYITPIKNTLSYAEKLDYITMNPWEKVSASKYGKRKNPKGSFQLQELKEILLLPMRPEDYLLFVLCITTGARMDEMALIRHSDVKVEQGTNIDYVDLTHVNALLKNESSKRLVPLLPEVRRAMTIDPDKAEARLFSYPLNEDNKTTPALSKRLNRIINKVNDDSRFTFHSFRHTFRSRGRIFGLSDELIRFTMGHGPKDVSETYGDPHPLTVKLEAIQTLGYKAILPDRRAVF